MHGRNSLPLPLGSKSAQIGQPCWDEGSIPFSSLFLLWILGVWASMDDVGFVQWSMREYPCIRRWVGMGRTDIAINEAVWHAGGDVYQTQLRLAGRG
jgi:hypothetical protein